MSLDFKKRNLYAYWEKHDKVFLKIIKKVDSCEYWTHSDSAHSIIYLSFLKEHLLSCLEEHLISETHDFLEILTYLPFSCFIEFLIYLKDKDPLVLLNYIKVSFIYSKAHITSGMLFYKRLNIIKICDKLEDIIQEEHIEIINQYLEIVSIKQ